MRKSLIAPEPPPTPNAQPAVWPTVVQEYITVRGSFAKLTVVELMQQRDAQGRAKYGVPLQPHNGRDATIDLVQELLDACAYLQQLQMEGRPLESYTNCLRDALFAGIEDVLEHRHANPAQ